MPQHIQIATQTKTKCQQMNSLPTGIKSDCELFAILKFEQNIIISGILKENIHISDKMANEKFCLRWNDFETSISGAFKELRDDKDFFDVTLACEDNQVQAHKVILSACSPY